VSLETKAIIASAIVGFCIGLVIAGCSLAPVMRGFKNQAIDRGHAEWRVITGTNKTEFKWKDEQ
jgi:hypothetical protein